MLFGERLLLLMIVYEVSELFTESKAYISFMCDMKSTKRFWKLRNYIDLYS